MGIFFLFFPNQSGIIGGILWLIFVFIPIVGLRQVNRLVYQERFQTAQRWASVLSWLHPGDGWREQPRVLQALHLTQQGKTETAKRVLNQDSPYPNYSFDQIAKAIEFRREARWDDCLRWLQMEIPEPLLWENSTLVAVYLRCLGEKGHLNRLIGVVQSHQNQIQSLDDSMLVNLARLYVFAFSGEVREVKNLLASPLNVYPQNIKLFWLATAQMAFGNQQEGLQLIYKINPKDIALENAIAQRVSHPLPLASQVLTPESLRIKEAIRTDLRHEINYGGAISLTPSKAYTTYSIMMINILVFIVELVQGGSQNLETLYYLGAAVPNAIFSGEPWRILTANFLHYGYIHIGSNLLGLWILGPYVEFYLGFMRYLIIYFISGVGAISSFAGLAMVMERGDDVLVGASAAIMGLMGATFIILWRGWRKDKSEIAQERLKLVTLIIGLQVVFDFSVANVSFLGHFFGLIFGMISATVLLSLTGKKVRN
jgi:membrane associated rhomboid family serine protease